VDIWTGFVIGLAGSLHCIGMCGPIALALAPGESSRMNHLVGRILYNLGRSVTYGLMGLAAGAIGHTVHVGGYQQIVSIMLGVLLLLAILLPSRFGALLTGTRFHARLSKLIGDAWKRLIRYSSPPSLLTIGILNGFLPCGLVYVALAGAVSTASPISGGLYMVAFGLGTLPVMLAISLAGRLVGHGLRSRMNRLLPVAGGLLAVLFILRGLSLGIPYISPRPVVDNQGQQTMKCCEHKAVSIGIKQTSDSVITDTDSLQRDSIRDD